MELFLEAIVMNDAPSNKQKIGNKPGEPSGYHTEIS